MNCKPGDMAIIIRSQAGNEGKLVDIIAPLGTNPVFDGSRWNYGSNRDKFSWLVRTRGQPLLSTRGDSYIEMPFPDAFMRPIRPDELEDDIQEIKELELS